MSVRGLWVLSRAEKNGEVLFSRRFPTVERRQEMSCKKTEGSKYFPLPTDADMLTAVLKFHNYEDDRVRADTFLGTVLDNRTMHTIPT